MSRLRVFVWLVSICLLAAPTTALARNDFHDLSVSEAKNSEAGVKLLDVPFYMKGQAHPAVAKSFGTFSSNRRTNAFGRSDEAACQVAFLSAVIALQQRAKAEGGNAVVDIVSTTKNNDLSSASSYRCAAGFAVANVALSGRVVKIAR